MGDTVGSKRPSLIELMRCDSINTRVISESMATSSPRLIKLIVDDGLNGERDKSTCLMTD